MEVRRRAGSPRDSNYRMTYPELALEPSIASRAEPSLCYHTLRIVTSGRWFSWLPMLQAPAPRAFRSVRHSPAAVR